MSVSPTAGTLHSSPLDTCNTFLTMFEGVGSPEEAGRELRVGGLSCHLWTLEPLLRPWPALQGESRRGFNGIMNYVGRPKKAGCELAREHASLSEDKAERKLRSNPVRPKLNTIVGHVHRRISSPIPTETVETAHAPPSCTEKRRNVPIKHALITEMISEIDPKMSNTKWRSVITFCAWELQEPQDTL